MELRDTKPENLRRRLKKHMFKLVPTAITEAQRLNVSWTRRLAPYLERAATVLAGVDPRLFFNLDEVGVQAWADAGSTKVLVPQSFEGTTFNMPVKRANYRITLLACVSMLGHRMRFLGIVPTASIELGFWKNGWEDMCLPVSSAKAFINSHAMLYWIIEVFAKELATLRERCDPDRRRAVLLMDGCTVHFTKPVQEALHNLGVEVLQLPAHSSHITQPLDLVNFSDMKRKLRKIDASGSPTEVLGKAVHALEGATNSKNVRAGFRRAGFVLDAVVRGDNKPVLSIRVVRRRVRKTYEKFAQPLASSATEQVGSLPVCSQAAFATFHQAFSKSTLAPRPASPPVVGRKRVRLPELGMTKEEKAELAAKKREEQQRKKEATAQRKEDAARKKEDAAKKREETAQRKEDAAKKKAEEEEKRKAEAKKRGKGSDDSFEPQKKRTKK